MGGLSSAAFYGGGKAVESLEAGIRKVRQVQWITVKVSNDYFRTGEHGHNKAGEKIKTMAKRE